MQHTTVLLHEAVDGLELMPGAIVVDGTFGSGGHAREILTHLDASGMYIGIDADQTALDVKKVGEANASVHLKHSNFHAQFAKGSCGFQANIVNLEGKLGQCYRLDTGHNDTFN